MNKCITLCSLMTMVMTATSQFNNLAEINCGRRKSIQRTGKIVGGENAEKGEFPWLVSLTRRGGHFCGGTVISEKYILTAGHCLCTGIDQDTVQPTAIKVTLSQHDLTDKNSEAYQMSVKAINIHPGYVCSKPKDDIAILELENVIHWSDSVVPACLPFTENRDEFNNLLAIVAGWGWTNENSEKGGRANTLQKAKVNIIKTEKCREWYKAQGKSTKIQESHICAGYEHGGIDSCWADSGGPLMLNNNQHDQITVVGVVSTGVGCARPYLPGLYTRLSDYLTWIQEILEK